jgi:flagellar basal body-associated protein FliL
MAKLGTALGIVAGALAAIIAAGTIYAFASGFPDKKASPGGLPPAGGPDAYFEGIGAIRARTADKETKIVAATISCLYDASDLGFSEELRSKAPALRAAAKDFFSRKRAAELGPSAEGRVKEELRARLDSLLSLGKLKEVFFSDFAVIE